MRNCVFALVTVLLTVTLLWWPGGLEAQAVTYQLQVASVSERVFMHFVEGSTLPRAEAFFDDTRRSKYVLFRDRQPQMLGPVSLDQAAPLPGVVTPAERNDPWGPTTWDGEAGQLTVFRIRGKQSDHQKLGRVALRTKGLLTRLPVRNIPVSQSRPMHVPATSAGYLTHILETGMFGNWVEKRATSYDGLSVIVGRHHDAQESDTVYVVVRTPQVGQTYKVILGWKTVKREGTYANRPGKRN